MVANPVLRSLFWIMDFVTLIGNLVTNILTLMEMVFDIKVITLLTKATSLLK